VRCRRVCRVRVWRGDVEEECDVQLWGVYGSIGGLHGALTQCQLGA
jgi:hypothetical protein